MKKCFKGLLPDMKLKNCIFLILGSAILAFGLFNVHSFSGVTEGGTLGLTLLLEHWLHISPALSSLILNGICYFVGWRTLGKDFIAYSAVCCLSFSLFYWMCEMILLFDQVIELSKGKMKGGKNSLAVRLLFLVLYLICWGMMIVLFVPMQILKNLMNIIKKLKMGKSTKHKFSHD